MWCWYAANWTIAVAAALCILASARPIPWSILVAVTATTLNTYVGYTMASLGGQVNFFAPYMFIPNEFYFFLHLITATAVALLIAVLAKVLLSKHWPRFLGDYKLVRPRDFAFLFAAVLCVSCALLLITNYDVAERAEHKAFIRLNKLDPQKLSAIIANDNEEVLERCRASLVLSGLGLDLPNLPERIVLLQNMEDDQNFGDEVKFAIRLAKQQAEFTKQNGYTSLPGFRRIGFQEMSFFNMLSSIFNVFQLEPAEGNARDFAGVAFHLKT